MKNKNTVAKDTQGVNTTPKTTTNSNNTQTAPVAQAPDKKDETEAPATVPPVLRTLEQQIEFFLGLERLVNIRRRFEKHLEAVEKLEIVDEDLAQFETGNRYGVRIELHDSARNEYPITNPRLVKDILAHLTTLLKGKIDHYNDEIMTYGAGEAVHAA